MTFILIKKLYKSLILVSLLALITSCDSGAKMSNDELLQNAKIAGESADWEQVLLLSSRATKNNPEDANAHIMLSLAQENSDKPKLAIEEIQKAVAINPESFMAQYNLGRILFKQSKYYKCIAPLKEANKLNPEDNNVLLLLGQASVIIKNFDDAKVYYLQLCRIDKFRYQAYNELGLINSKQGNKKVALKYLLNARKIASKNPTITYNLAIFCDTIANNQVAARNFYIQYLLQTTQNKELKVKRDKIAKRAKAIKN